MSAPIPAPQTIDEIQGLLRARMICCRCSASLLLMPEVHLIQLLVRANFERPTWSLPSRPDIQGALACLCPTCYTAVTMIQQGKGPPLLAHEAVPLVFEFYQLQAIDYACGCTLSQEDPPKLCPTHCKPENQYLIAQQQAVRIYPTGGDKIRYHSSRHLKPIDEKDLVPQFIIDAGRAKQ